ncbi:T9SS C-terminal target domain-containing protein, partial [Sphingobacteriales bacterium UPWRP_1]
QPATTVAFLLPAASVDEAAGTYSLCVDINNPDAINATSVAVALTGGSALNGTDVATYTTQTVTFPAGSSANQCVTLTIVDDTDAETNETLIFTLQSPAGGNSAAIGTIATITVTITDNDSGPQPCPDLAFSGYVEGSGFNKCVEIFNGTGADVDLSNYSVQLYNNGNTAVNSTIPLSGILANGEYFLLCHADALLDGLVPDQSSASLNYNGDDAVALLNEVTNLNADVIGTIGFDPGSEWAGSVCTGGTQDQTLVKKNLGTLCPYDSFAGVTDFSASVDALYDCYPNNTSNVLNTWQNITCNISNINISTTCTSQLLYDLTVTFTVVDPVSATYVVTVGGNDYVRTYSGSTTQTFTINDLPEGNGLTTNTVTITDAGYGLCSELASYVVPDCTLPCSIGSLFASASCSGNGVYDLSVSFDVTSPAGTGFVVTVNGTGYNGTYAAGSAQTYTITGLTGSPGVGSITVTDATNAACNATAAYDIPDCIIECSVLNGTQNVNSTAVCSGQPVEYFAGGVTDNDYTGGSVTWVYSTSAGFDAYTGGTVFTGILPANNGCTATVWYLKARLDGVPGCTGVSGEFMVAVYPNISITVTQSGGCTAAVAASCSATVTWVNPATGAVQSNVGSATYTAPNCTAGSVTFNANLPGSPAACQGSVAVAYNCNQGGCGTTGCTDAIAVNYNPFATVDDGSCQYEACTDPAAVNYTPPAANIVSNNSLCVYAQCPLDFTITNNTQGAGVVTTFFDVFTITLGGTAPYSYDWTISGYVTYSINGNTITVVVSDGATWSLQVADASGCQAVVSEDAYNNNPTATTLDIVSAIITADNGGGTGAIDISVGGGVTPYGYLWSNGATTQDISGLPYGWYTVTVTDAAGNQTFGWYWVPKQTRGRGKTAQETMLNAFPNPFTNAATVVFSSPQSGNATLSVYNTAGVEVARLFNGFAEANVPQTLTFNAANLPAGVYVLQLITQNGAVEHSRMVLSR